MKVILTVAGNFRNMYYGPNATGVSMSDILEGIDYKQATKQVHDLNTIAVLLFHINYYVAGIMEVMKGKPLTIRDKYSFDMEPINSEADWEALQSKVLTDVEEFHSLVLDFTEEKMKSPMDDPKYGSWYKNLLGLIEHSHYHMGQIALLKKIVTSSESK